MKTTFQKYPAYKDSGAEWLGDIPEHWNLTRLGSHFEERKTKVSDKDFVPLSVTKHGILPQLDSAAKTNDGDNRKLVRKGDFVINSRSDRKGSSGIANEDGSVSLINIVMKPISIHPSFCNYLLKSNAFVEENYRIGHGIVADLWTTRYDEMKNIKIGVPSTEEQTAIANFLDDKTEKIDRAIAQKERMITLLKERKQILIQDVVTGKKVWNANQNAWTEPTKVKDSGVEWIGEIPEHWGVLFNRRLFRENNRKVTNLNELPLSLSQIDGVIPSEEMKERSLSPSHRNNFKICLPNDLIVNRFKGHLGVFFRSPYRGIVTFHYGVFEPSRLVNTKYYELLYHTEPYKCIYAGASNGMTIGLQNLSNQNFYDVKSIVPPIEEQNSIVDYSSEIEEKTQKVIKFQLTQIEKLKELKSTLIDSAVTGKIKVR
ncbi:MAG: restriction endonuclease subunit S [Candidatus Kapaibacterium sp.]|nr:restriction endonuclease subunit S [Bacteroidota bacterium]